VTAAVIEHVSKRTPHLERRLQQASMKPIRKNAAGAFEQAIEPLGEPNRECLHSARQALPVVCLHDEVKMV
jgi:hypothetical protein